MVVFTCQHCGESLKKPKVEKHYMIKPGCKFKGPNLTCVDCLKDFRGNEYVEHTQCVSEAQRYAATGTVFKEPAGQSKQAKYIELIQGLLDSADLTPIQQNLLTVCSTFENVPKKWPKFKNFSKNVIRGVQYNENDLKSVFDLIEGAWKQEIQAKITNGKSPEKNEMLATSPEKNGLAHDESEKSPQNVDNCVSKKVNKKKHKEKNNSLICEKDTLGGEDVGLVSEEMVVENGGDDSNPKEITVSKKKLKKQKKYEKYLMELENVTKSETNLGMEIEENHKDEIMEGDDSSDKKSKKKSKKSKVLLESANSEPAAVSENGNSMEVENSETQKKKKKDKKRKLDDSSCEIAEKRAKDTSEGEEVEAPQATFNWGEVIARVLESRPDMELSLKRLGKKVIDEYQTMKPDDHRTYEQLLAKFNKKVKKTIGVRVFKDKAKLIE